MATASITFDAFRFLDIRSPRVGVSERSAYVVTRDLLNFDETEFETNLVRLASDKDYLKNLLTAAKKKSPDETSFDGFAADAAKYEQCLLQPQSTPESVCSDFQALYSKLRGETSEEEYLKKPSSRIWDAYLAATIMRIANSAIDDDLLVKLSQCLRVAGALFALGASPNGDLDVRSFVIASIAIRPDLIRPDAVVKALPQASPSKSDTIARELQNRLILDLLRKDLASQELQAALHLQTAEVQAPPGGGGGGGGAGGVKSLSPGKCLLRIPKSLLSKSTQGLLIEEFGATSAANTIDNVDIILILLRLDTARQGIGKQLFSSTTQSRIIEFENQAKLLRLQLSMTGEIEEEKIDAIALNIVPPIPIPSPFPQFYGNAYVRPLGIGDLKVVKQNLLRYQAGEVSDIENVLKGQSKERVHSVKQTTEETLLTDEEQTTSIEKDLQTTDRFELSDQIATTFSEQQKTQAGVTVTASYGPVSISANTNYSDTSAQEQSSKISRNFARDVVNKSVQKVEQRIRQERIKKTSLEILESNKYTQSVTDANVVGIYRWVDKIYWAQVNVYGKRLMLEFMVPEPAALYLYGQSVKPVDQTAVKPPEPLTITPDQITPMNYAALAARYSAEVENPPPPARLAKFVARSEKDTQETVLKLEDGWIGLLAGPSASWVGTPGRLYVHIADQIWDSNTPWQMEFIQSSAAGDVPLLVTFFQVSSYNVAGTVVCAPTSETIQKWQLSTYKVLVDAYRLLESKYEDYLASQNKNDSNAKVIQDQVSRDIEQRELQRACTEILTLQHFNLFGCIVDNPSTGWPEIDFDKAKSQGDFALFFQQSFEWDQMTYAFYPYFWGRQARWPEMLAANSGDGLFDKFLNAGFARVVLPVTPAHESDVLFFVKTGIIWGGTEPPVFGDPRFVSIIDEIKQQLDAPDGGVPEGDPWQFKVPTSLVLLSDSSSLPEWPADLPTATTFVPSEITCNGIPYNAAQWKDSKSIADAIRKLGYSIDAQGDQDQSLRKSKGTIRAMQMRFNDLGAVCLLGADLAADGVVGPCTLRALTYFDNLRSEGKWPGIK